MLRRLARYVPAIAWLPACSAETIRADVLAGVAVAALLIPQAMAYAGIAGVKPQAGLFTLAIGLLAYALFGSSRHLAVSATSGSAAMLAALVAPLAGGDAVKYALLASATAISVGILLFVGGVFKLGFVSEFISKPVLKGFVFGLALTIMLKQAPTLLGIEKGSGDFFHQLWSLLTRLGHVHPATIFVGATALAITFGLAAVAPRIPSALVVFVAGIVAARMLGLEHRGVEVVGTMQGGMPHFTVPNMGREHWAELLSGAVGIVLILFAEALAAARTFAAKNKYEIDANQELKSLAVANVASGLFQGIVVGGGMSGTAANASAGARTQVSGIAASGLTILTLAFLTPLFRDLPQAVLAAIVINAVVRLADVAELRRFARLRTGSIWVALTALAGVLAFGILKGLILAVCLTLIALMKKISTPQISILGRLHATGTFVDVTRYPDAELVPGVLIVRVNGVLFFANATRVLNYIRQLLKEAAQPVRAVILNLEAVTEIDITSLDLLEQLRSDLEEMNIRLVFARASDPVFDLFSRSGFRDRLGHKRMFRGVDLAVASCTQSAAQPAGAS